MKEVQNIPWDVHRCMKERVFATVSNDSWYRRMKVAIGSVSNTRAFPSLGEYSIVLVTGKTLFGGKRETKGKTTNEKENDVPLISWHSPSPHRFPLKGSSLLPPKKVA